MGLFSTSSKSVFTSEKQGDFNSNFPDFNKFKIPLSNPFFPILYLILPNIIVNSNNKKIIIVNLIYFNINKLFALQQTKKSRSDFRLFTIIYNTI